MASPGVEKEFCSALVKQHTHLHDVPNPNAVVFMKRLSEQCHRRTILGSQRTVGS